MNEFERTEAGNLTDEGIRQYLVDRISNITKDKDKQITELKIENAKLNIILYHRENGLSHSDFNAELEISKQSERIKELETEKENLRQYASGLENAQNLITVRYRELEAGICPSWMGKEKGCNEAQDVEKIEAALQGMVPFIEDDFPNGTGKNHGTCATDEYQQACDAVIKAIKS